MEIIAEELWQIRCKVIIDFGLGISKQEPISRWCDGLTPVRNTKSFYKMVITVKYITSRDETMPATRD